MMADRGGHDVAKFEGTEDFDREPSLEMSATVTSSSPDEPEVIPGQKATTLTFVHLDSSKAKPSREQLRFVRSWVAVRNRAQARKKAQAAWSDDDDARSKAPSRHESRATQDTTDALVKMLVASATPWKALSPARFDPFDTCVIELKPYAECSLHWVGGAWPESLLPENVPESAVVQYNAPNFNRILTRKEVIHATLASLLFITPAGSAVVSKPGALAFEHRGKALRYIRQQYEKCMENPSTEDVMSLAIAIGGLAPLEMYFGDFDAFAAHVKTIRKLMKSIGGFGKHGVGGWHLLEGIMGTLARFGNGSDLEFDELGVPLSIMNHLRVENLSVASLPEVIDEIRSLQLTAVDLYSPALSEVGQRIRFDYFCSIRAVIDLALAKLEPLCDAFENAQRESLIMFMLIEFRKMPGSLDNQDVIAGRIRVALSSQSAEYLKDKQSWVFWMVAICAVPLRPLPQSYQWFVRKACEVGRSLGLGSFAAMRAEMKKILWPTQAELMLWRFWDDMQTEMRT